MLVQAPAELVHADDLVGPVECVRFMLGPDDHCTEVSLLLEPRLERGDLVKLRGDEELAIPTYVVAYCVVVEEREAARA